MRDQSRASGVLFCQIRLGKMLETIALSAKQLNINVHYLFSSLLNKVIKNHNSDEQRTDSLIKDFWEMFDLILS